MRTKSFAARLRALTIPRWAIATGSAYLLVLFAIDATQMIADIFIPSLPGRVGGLPWLFWLPFLLILALPSGKTPESDQILRPADAMLVLTLLIWALLEALHMGRVGHGNFTMVIDSFWPIAVYMVSRAHFTAFRDVRLLVDSFVRVIVVVGSLHLVLLVFIQNDMHLPFVNSAEVPGRNGISILLVFAFFVRLFCRKAGRAGSLAQIGLFCLAAVHISLNQSRGTALLLLATVAAWLVLSRFRWHRGTAFVFLLGAISIVAAAALAGVALSLLGWPNESELVDDPTLSLVSRVLTNGLISQLFLSSPLIGVGFAEVIDTRVAGYFSHTLYLIYLSSYGAVGMIPLVWALGHVFGIFSKSTVGRNVGAFGVFFVVAVTSLVNDPLAWLGALPLFLLAADAETEAELQKRWGGEEWQ